MKWERISSFFFFDPHYKIIFEQFLSGTVIPDADQGFLWFIHDKREELPNAYYGSEPTLEEAQLACEAIYIKVYGRSAKKYVKLKAEKTLWEAGYVVESSDDGETLLIKKGGRTLVITADLLREPHLVTTENTIHPYTIQAFPDLFEEVEK